MEEQSVVKPWSGATLAAIFLGLILGCALQLQQAALWGVAVYVSVLLLALLGAGWRGLHAGVSQGAGGAVVLCAAMVCLSFSVTGLRASAQASSALALELEGQDVVIKGVVTDMPQYRENSVRFHFKVESASLAGQSVRLPNLLALSWYQFQLGSSWGKEGQSDAVDVGPASQPLAALLQQSPVYAGERWQWTARLKAPHGAINPFGFDSELRLWEQGVQAVGYVRTGAKDPVPQRLAQTWAHPVQWARQQLRERIAQQGLDPRGAGVVAALVLGDQAAIEREDWQIFKATGVAHLMSISGLHITMFAWLAVRLVGMLWRRSSSLCLRWPAPHAALVGGVLLALVYAIFSGWGIPAQRTVLMLSVVSGLRLAGLRWPWPQVWLLVCSVVVVIDPWALLQAGFWLSFVAVGVLFANAPEQHRAQSHGLWIRLRAMVQEQALITLALAPLSLLLFGQFSLVGLLANLLAIPWVTLVVTPLAMLGSLVPGLWHVAVLAIGALVNGLEVLAAWPWAVVVVAKAHWSLGLLAVLGGLCLALRLPWSLRLLGVPLLLPVLFWQPLQPPPGEFELLAADIGQGNAVLVRTQNHALLYDAGPSFGPDSDAGQSILLPLMRALSVQLDRVVLSHRDSDHTGGAAAVLSIHTQADVLSSMEEGHMLQKLRPAKRCVAGQHWQWDGVDFDVLHPQADDYEGRNKPNAMSCVLRVGNARGSALLVGDIEKKQEERLLTLAPQALRSVVLLVPHHGSKTSSSEAFLDVVQPRTALVQSGYRNRYGHPANSVTERYQNRGIVVLQTPQCGAVTWQSWRATTARCERLESPRYWRHLP